MSSKVYRAYMNVRMSNERLEQIKTDLERDNVHKYSIQDLVQNVEEARLLTDKLGDFEDRLDGLVAGLRAGSGKRNEGMAEVVEYCLCFIDDLLYGNMNNDSWGNFK